LYSVTEERLRSYDQFCTIRDLKTDNNNDDATEEQDEEANMMDFTHIASQSRQKSTFGGERVDSVNVVEKQTGKRWKLTLAGRWMVLFFKF
jgi:hypothetical protein